MKKFGLRKKSEGDEDSGRRALFGSRSKNKSSAPPTNNPYAQPTAPPDPYTQAKMNAGIIPSAQESAGPRPPPGARGGLPGGPSGRNDYGGGALSNVSQGDYSDNKKFEALSGGYGRGGGYGNEKFGNAAGYGQDKFGSAAYSGGGTAAASPRYGADGYGGLGRTDNIEDTSTDANRDALFGDARERVQQRGPNGYGQPPPYDIDAAPGGGQDRGYGAYGDRQLTAEEEEEEDVAATKQEIRSLKKQDVSSTRNALQVAKRAEESGQNTLALLGAQGERLHNTERNLDLAGNHQRMAGEKAEQLRVANRGMLSFHANNPFTQRGRERQDQEILDRHRTEREQREATRQAAFESGQRMNQNFKGIETASTAGPKSKSRLAERSKYQFEADSEDDAMEDEIENNLMEIKEAARRLNMLAKAQGDEVRQQNTLLEGLGKKVCMATDNINEMYANIHFSERPSRRSTCHESKTARPHQLKAVFHGATHVQTKRIFVQVCFGWNHICLVL